MRLFLAEKPSVARDIAAAVGASKRQDGYLEGDQALVTWAFGHLVQIDDPEAMDPAWGQPWRLEQLPMLPADWRYRVTTDGKKQFGVIKHLIADSRVKEVVCATDAGREGERIFRLIYRLAGGKAPVKRLWVSSLTDEALREGIAHLRPGADFEALGRAAEARARADWLVGLNCTRAYTLRNAQKCTCGRVQTPTLALIVNRQREIEAFRPVPYWEIQVDLAAADASFRALYVNADDVPRIDSSDRAKAIVDELTAVQLVQCVHLDTREHSNSAPPLHDLLTLQKDANRRWGYTAAQVLETAQALYETHKLLTYPRTESRYLPTDMVATFPKILNGLAGKYPDLVPRALARSEPLGAQYVNDAKLTDHHAIVPTGRPGEALQLGEAEQRLYDLVARRFIAAFYPARRTQQTVARFAAGPHQLRSNGTVVLDPGWTIVEHPAPTDEDEEDPTKQTLPALDQGKDYPKRSQRLVEKKTKAPRPYNDASLLDAMKRAGADLDDKDLKKYMAAAGLGTAATRAEIIEKLIRTEYLERQKKILVATPKGVALIDQVHPDLKDPALTGRWEQRLKAIEDGDGDADAFERDVGDYVRQLLATVGDAKPIARLPEPGIGPCPACKEGTVLQTSKGYGCSRWREGCKFVIWKQVAGKTISEKVATELVVSGRTARKIAGFKSKAGKPFEARLRLDDNNKVVFTFDD